MAVLDVPDWLSDNFLKSCLETDYENFSEMDITKHRFESVVPEGNNYGSLLLRVILDYRKPNSNDQSISLIIKAPLTAEYIEKITEMFPDLYEKEPKYYKEFIKETYKLSQHDIVPKCYPAPNPLCVVLEDLTSSGFVMVDRHKLLDFDHSKLYIEASAKLHALSIAIYKTNPGLIESLTKETPDMEEKMKESFKGLMSLNLKCMVAYLEDKPNCEKYIEVMKKLDKEDRYWKLYQEMEKGEKPLKAMIQSDPWCTNMMFTYSASGKVERIKIIDFQNLRFTTPILEFITFLWVSVNPEVRETRMNDFYQLYCDCLNGNLQELGCSERLPFQVLKYELLRLSPAVLTTTCFMMPFCVSDGAADMNTLFGESSTNVPVRESSIYKLYQGTTFSKYALQIMKQVEREGVFDYLKRKSKSVKSPKFE